ncbi:MAG: Xaa-Pro peptidase family protein [bacterium]|nr:Xaa-Pro peptidase family protein [bacterium]MDT8365811.1 Xaa-Pro peptidase family protein [bacterium]
MSHPPLFHFAESYNDADQYHLSGFLCPDPFAVLEITSRKVILAVSSMEEGRAKLETSGKTVVSLHRKKSKPLNKILADLIRDHGTERIRVLPSFPVGLAQELKGEGIGIEIDGRTLRERRRVKTLGQIKAIEQAQRSCEGVFTMVRSLLAGCPVKGDVLFHEGRPLTAQKVRSMIEVFFLERGFETADTIFAPGRGGADPHWRGVGPIHAGVPIVMDVFPRSRTSRYHSDMSRTFVVGRATRSVREMHAAVVEAQDVALERIKQGIPLSEVHQAVCELFRKRGYPVPGDGKPPRRGFLHGTGHGLGLEIHESPSVSVTAEIFQPGDVVTIEPGLYDRRIGGMRIEDVVACMPDGTVRNLTNFPKDLEIL